MVALAMSTLVVACADLDVQQREPPTVGTVRACDDQITIAGRFSAQYRKDGRDEAVHGSFHWVQSGQNTSVSLLSPLGQTLATIDVTPGKATLTSAGNPPRIAADADALALASLGWQLPVSGLRDWLQGCALEAHGRRFIATPASQHVNTPDGWQIDYPVWEDDGAKTRRPKRIDLQRIGDNSAPEISLRLVIDTWLPAKK